MKMRKKLDGACKLIQKLRMGIAYSLVALILMGTTATSSAQNECPACAALDLFNSLQQVKEAIQTAISATENDVYYNGTHDELLTLHQALNAIQQAMDAIVIPSHTCDDEEEPDVQEDLCSICYLPTSQCTCNQICSACYQIPCNCYQVCSTCYATGSNCTCSQICSTCYQSPCICSQLCSICYQSSCSCYQP